MAIHLSNILKYLSLIILAGQIIGYALGQLSLKSALLISFVCVVIFINIYLTKKNEEKGK